MSHVYAKEEGMVVVRIEGRDAAKVLQALSTQHIPEFIESQQALARAEAENPESLVNSLKTHPNATADVQVSSHPTRCAFLTPKGRLLYESPLDLTHIPAEHAAPEALPAHTAGAVRRSPQLAANAYTDAAFALVLPRAHAAAFIAHVKENSLRVKATMVVDEAVDVWTVLARDEFAVEYVAKNLTLEPNTPVDSTNSDNNAGTLPTVRILHDRRPLAGAAGCMTVLVPASHSLRLPPVFTHVADTVPAVFRTLQAVPVPGLDLEPGKHLPLEAGLSLTGAVHIHKGCYLGQELTARTHFQGLIRKRVMPVALTPAETPAPFPKSTASSPASAPRLSSLVDREADDDALFAYTALQPDVRVTLPELPPADSPLRAVMEQLTAATPRFPETGDALRPAGAKASDREVGRLLSVPARGNVALAMVRLSHAGEALRVSCETEAGEVETPWTAWPIMPDYVVDAEEKKDE
jgi:folate-binding protein YgfZ